VRLRHDGANRVATVHIPDNPSGVAMPVVFNFHGFLSSASQQRDYARLEDVADEKGFIAVHADGVNHSWNAGSCCGWAMATDLDDVGFVVKLLDEVAGLASVDRTRVYAMGMSNGGFMSFRLACERADLFAAITSVTGINGFKDCNPSAPVGVLHFHGTEDRIVPYEGDTQNDFAPAAESTREWAKRMGCAETTTDTALGDDVQCRSFDGCPGAAEVTFCTVDGGGHTWPGAQEYAFLGKTTQSVDATRMAVDFLLRHRRVP
jgi:polyhydroxybutyrate depolymerase